MSRSKDNEGVGGSFSVDGQSVEIDMAEFGWDRPVSKNGGADRGAGDDFDDDPNAVRLQKALAAAGVASRRACETLITSGRVSVNGRVCEELGSRVIPGTDEVRVDGVVVQLDVSKRYFVLNKPRGVVSTMKDEHDRGDLREFTNQIDDRLYNVGRLDSETSGLLVLTNDGELAHKLAHPSFGVQKTYVAKVRGRITAAAIQQLLDGVTLADGEIQADRAKILPDGAGRSHSLVEITLHSGRNRIVRRMLSEVGFPVEELVRRQFGPLHLGTLRVGELRELSGAERGALLSIGEEGDGAERAVSGTAAAAKPASRKGWAKNKDRGPAARGASARKAAARKTARAAGEGNREREGYRGRDERGGAGRSDFRGRDDHRGGRDSFRGREDRGERGGYRGRDDRGFQGRDERNDRGGFERRDDRGGRGDQGGFRGGRDDRGDRGGYRGRDDRGFQGRDDRGGFDRRDDRGGRGFERRDDQGGRGGFRGGRDDRDERGARDDFRGDRGGRGERNDFRGRDHRGGRDDRGDRGGYRGRDDRGFQGRDERNDRGGFDRRENRDNRGDRDSRGDRGYQRGRDDSGRGGQRNRGEITAGRPGDGKGARGMRGAAARGNPHRRSY